MNKCKDMLLSDIFYAHPNHPSPHKKEYPLPNEHESTWVPSWSACFEERNLFPLPRFATSITYLAIYSTLNRPVFRCLLFIY